MEAASRAYPVVSGVTWYRPATAPWPTLPSHALRSLLLLTRTATTAVPALVPNPLWLQVRGGEQHKPAHENWCLTKAVPHVQFPVVKNTRTLGLRDPDTTRLLLREVTPEGKDKWTPLCNPAPPKSQHR